MRITGRSSNVEDRRGMGGPLIAGGGIGALVIAVIVMLLGGDPAEVLQTGTSQQGTATAQNDAASEWVKGVLFETEETWGALFRDELNRPYEQPKLVLFDSPQPSACGTAHSAVGPFYCPLDRTVYLDLSFYRALKERFGAPGDAAQAYVIAHEVGHHVQTLLGVSDQVRRAREGASGRESNALSVRQELQADCFAGLWASRAHREREIWEPGDTEEALGAASAVGDDRLQRRTQGQIVPESFTHGSSAQRVEWFQRGFQSGKISACDTFG